MLRKTWLYDLICFVLVLNYFYEGVQKLAYLDVYGFWITHAPVIRKFGSILKYAIPISEIVIAVLLLMPKFRKAAFIASIFMQIGFILWVMSVYLFTGYLFWPYHALWDNPTWMQKMVYGLMLAWMALTGILLSRSKTRSNGKIKILKNEAV
jgi:uncharacterized membrane protein YphA (DoxX/SURF4 family)